MPPNEAAKPRQMKLTVTPTRENCHITRYVFYVMQTGSPAANVTDILDARAPSYGLMVAVISMATGTPSSWSTAACRS